VAASEQTSSKKERKDFIASGLPSIKIRKITILLLHYPNSGMCGGGRNIWAKRQEGG
jgi:hypothetical protein